MVAIKDWQPDLDQHPIMPLIGPLKRLEHLIRFAGRGMVDRGRHAATVRGEELLDDFFTPPSVAAHVAGCRQRTRGERPPGGQLDSAFKTGNCIRGSPDLELGERHRPPEEVVVRTHFEGASSGLNGFQVVSGPAME